MQNMADELRISDWSSDVCSSDLEFASFKTLQSQEAESGFIEKSLHSRRFFRSGRAGGWRETLTPGQAAAIEHLHAEQMRRFGYLPPPAQDAGSSTAARVS